MVRKILAGLIILASIVIMISFFMPWARVSVSVIGVSKQLSGSSHLPDKVVKKMQEITATMSSFGDVDIKTTVSGYKIPGMVNSQTSKVALSAVEILSKSTSGLDRKSYLVYLLPLLGIVCGILALAGLKNRACIIIMLIIGGIVGIAGLYNLSTANLASMAVKIDILNGLWNTIYAFLFIFVAGIVWLVLGKKA